MLLLATLLEDPVDERWMSTLFAQFSAFNLVYVTTIRSIVETAPETAVIDINHVYICVKLWLLFACHRGQEQDKGDVPTLTVWNQLWPAFESLVRQYERDARKGISSVRVRVRDTKRELTHFPSPRSCSRLVHAQTCWGLYIICNVLLGCTTWHTWNSCRD